MNVAILLSTVMSNTQRWCDASPSVNEKLVLSMAPVNFTAADGRGLFMAKWRRRANCSKLLAAYRPNVAFEVRRNRRSVRVA